MDSRRASRFDVPDAVADGYGPRRIDATRLHHVEEDLGTWFWFIYIIGGGPGIDGVISP